MPVYIVLSLLSALMISCSLMEKPSDSVSRDPQAVENEAADENKKFEVTFQNLINSDETTKSTASFIQRQMQFFYIGQSLVNTFDQELDRLYKQKLKSPKSEITTEPLQKLLFELNIGREFVERNTHELQYVYKRLLEEAHRDGSKESSLQKLSQSTLASMETILAEGWEKGDRTGVISLASEFEQIGADFKETNPKAQVPEFSRFTKLSLKEREAASQQSLKYYNIRKRTFLDSFIQKKWRQYLEENKKQIPETLENRVPQAAAPYPDPGSAGNMTGSSFEPGVWALTFDDGPHPRHTQGMLDALKRGGYRGTFFWLTQNLKRYPELAEQVRQEGSRRASHSYTHANLPKLSEAGLKREIDQAVEEFETIIGSRPTFFRCPYGACGSNGSKIRTRIANNKMIHVFWNVDSLDWQDKNPNSIFQRVKKQMVLNGRGIVLFHDIHTQSAEATKLVVDYIHQRGDWKVLPLDEIVKMETGAEYPSP